MTINVRVPLSINAKKWTWPIFCRIIQSSIVNGVVLWNECIGDNNKKISTKDMCLKVSEVYLSLSKLDDYTATQKKKFLTWGSHYAYYMFLGSLNPNPRSM